MITQIVLDGSKLLLKDVGGIILHSLPSDKYITYQGDNGYLYFALDTVRNKENGIPVNPAVVTLPLSPVPPWNYEDLANELNLNFKGSADVFVQDQTTQPVIAKFNRVTNSTTLAISASKGDTSITLTSGAGLVAPSGNIPGSYIILFNSTTELFMFAHVTDITGSPTVVLDTPLDSDFDDTTFVDIGITNLSSLDGTLGAPIIYGLRGVGAPPGVDVTVDITRLILKCITNTAIDLTTFGDLDRLTNGLVLRRRNGTTQNIFNVKDNGEINGIMFDFVTAAATNPQQGIDGFTSRLTFAGANKVGVAIRLPIGDDLELLVQDALATIQATNRQILLFEIVAEGHLVQN